MKQNGFLYMSLAQQILKYIRDNHLKSGDRIPAERELVEMFSSSRSSVREAIRILQNQGILRTEIGRGTFLLDNSEVEQYSIALWKIDYKELLEVKMLLDVHIVEELCISITEPELRSLEEPLKKLEKDFSNGTFTISTDAVFHTRIRHMCHNQTLVQLVESINAKLDVYGKNVEGFEPIWIATVPYHRNLFTALQKHNAKLARKAYQEIYELDKQALERAGSIKSQATT